MSEPRTADELAEEHGLEWAYEPVSQAKCPCGEPLFGKEWWDGWAGEGEHTVECESCGQEWLAEAEYQEPCVVGLRASG